MEEATFTTATAVPAEGARVGFVSCKLCGATIMLDQRDSEDTIQKHITWHRHINRLLSSVSDSE